MNVVAILGSPRLQGNTNYLTDQALEEISKAGIETTKIVLSKYKINFCCGLDGCRRDFAVCAQKDDAQKLLTKLYEADGIILSSPVYFHNVTARLKVFMDRNRFNLYRKLRFKARTAGLILVATAGGLKDADYALMNFLKLCSRIPPEKVLHVQGIASRVGDANKKPELVEQARQMGRNMAAELLKSGNYEIAPMYSIKEPE
jgi:multimeric flavodoxin WrbA